MSQLEHTEFLEQGQSLPPLCSPHPGTALLHAFAGVARENPLPPPAGPPGSGEREEEEVTVQQQLRRVLQLMVVLWGDLSAQHNSSE